MFGSFQEWIKAVLEILNQILTAGISITAFSLLLYALAFNLHDRVANSFARIMFCVIVVFTAEALGSVASDSFMLEFWLRIQWIGIILLPAVFFQFSDLLLATTGKPSRGRRRLLTYAAYSLALCFLVALAVGSFVGPVIDAPPTPHLQATLITSIFSAYYLGMLALASYNFYQAYNRTTTPTSRRRMSYLIFGSLGPSLGSFQYLPFGSQLVANHHVLFWLMVVLSNIFILGLIILMAYAVSFFGISWPDRVVRRRLFKWLMRGPFTASVTLAVSTILSRWLVSINSSRLELVPIASMATLVLCEYLITIFSPLGEKLLLVDQDQEDLSALRRLEDSLLTRNDLSQLMEMVLGAICDQLQVSGAYVASLNGADVDLITRVGRVKIERKGISEQLPELITRNSTPPSWFRWGSDYLIPLESVDPHTGVISMLGLLGISDMGDRQLEEEQLLSLSKLSGRAEQVLTDWQKQQMVFQSIENLAPALDQIQMIRSAGGYSGSDLTPADAELVSEDLSQWVKDALTHYWGGPKFTENPLMEFNVVKRSAQEHNGNQANALRAILRKAIENVRPEGERRFTGEWVLYNILEMKFLEGRKVKEVASRLAVSEADLYRKQRVAIEAVANSILEMEMDLHSDCNQQIDTPQKVD